VNTPIGTFSKIEEAANGFYVEGKILATIDCGLEIYELLKAEAIEGLSIGFEVEDRFFDGEYWYISKLKL
jgi:phage head maturation protease